jgi:hypothetical protein
VGEAGKARSTGRVARVSSKSNAELVPSRGNAVITPVPQRQSTIQHSSAATLQCRRLLCTPTMAMPLTSLSRPRPWLKSTRRPLLRALPPPPARRLHLAPPWLLDDYIPRYHLISSVDAAKKRSQAYAHLRECNLCPRLCGVNRYEKTGFCLIGAEKVKVNTIAPHFGEGMAGKYT